MNYERILKAEVLQPTQLLDPSIFVLPDRRVKSVEELSKGVLERLILQVFVLFEKKTQENLGLDVFSTLSECFEECFKKKHLIITFDGSLDERGIPFSDSFTLDLVYLFNQFLKVYKNSFSKEVKRYIKSVDFNVRYGKYIEQLQQREIKIVLQNFDHHPKNSGNKIAFFERYTLPSSAQALFRYLKDLVLKCQNSFLQADKPSFNNKIKTILQSYITENLQIIGVHEPLNASDPDSLLCLILLKIFEKRPETFLNRDELDKLEMVVDFISIFDIFAGNPNPSIIYNFISKHREILIHFLNRSSVLIDEDGYINSDKFKDLELFVKSYLLPLVYRTLSKKPNTELELVEIVVKSVDSVLNFLNEGFQAVIDSSVKVDDGKKIESNGKVVLQIEAYESDDSPICVYILNGSDYDKIPVIQQQKAEQNKADIFITIKDVKESGASVIIVLSCIIYPSKDPTNTDYRLIATRKEKLEEEAKAAIGFKNFFNEFMKKIMTCHSGEDFNFVQLCEEAYNKTKNKEDELGSPLSPGCICGNRNKPIVLDKKFPYKEFIISAVEFYCRRTVS